jgi:hypothetical protein
MSFKPIAERRVVEYADLGVSVSVGTASADIEYLRVTATGFRVTPLEFIMVRFPSYGPASENQGPTMAIQVGDLEMMFRRAGLRNHEENTDIARLIVKGIYRFNEAWPQVKKAVISSDFKEAIVNGASLSFSLPDDAELAALSNGE